MCTVLVTVFISLKLWGWFEQAEGLWGISAGAAL